MAASTQISELLSPKSAKCDVLTRELEAARSHRLLKRVDLEFNHWEVVCGDTASDNASRSSEELKIAESLSWTLSISCDVI